MDVSTVTDRILLWLLLHAIAVDSNDAETVGTHAEQKEQRRKKHAADQGNRSRPSSEIRPSQACVQSERSPRAETTAAETLFHGEPLALTPIPSPYINKPLPSPFERFSFSQHGLSGGSTLIPLRDLAPREALIKEYEPQNRGSYCI